MEDCKYLITKDVTPWHGDVFDHPDYKYFCGKEEVLKEILWPRKKCSRCEFYET